MPRSRNTCTSKHSRTHKALVSVHMTFGVQPPCSARAVERDRSAKPADAGAAVAAGSGPANGNGNGAGDSDTDTDSELPLPPSHEKARRSDAGVASEQASRPPPGRVSAPDGGIGRGVVPRRTAADSDDEDEYVRQVGAGRKANVRRGSALAHIRLLALIIHMCVPHTS